MTYIENLFNAKKAAYSAWVSASAGTGKTKLLTDRVINLLLHDKTPEAILCLTFTKAARSEMLARINQTLYNWAKSSSEELAVILEEIYGAKHTDIQINRARKLYFLLSSNSKKIKIYTIHAFCQNLLQRFPIEAGIRASFNVIDEREAKYIINKIITSAGFIQELPEEIIKHSSIFSLSEILSESVFNLQRDISEDGILDRNGLFEAYSTYFGRRHSDKEFNKEQTLISMKKDIIKLFENALTAPFPDDPLMDAIKIFISCEPYELSHAFEVFLKSFLTQKEEPRQKIVSKDVIKNFPFFSDIVGKMQEKMLETHLQIKTYEIIQRSISLYRISQKILSLYNEYKTANNILDYEDLITYSCKLLLQSDMREWVKYKLDGGINHILVDESQDTSDMQWQIIQGLTNDFFSGIGSSSHIERSIFVVGDVKQSIYSFQGARPDLFYLTKELTKEQCISAGKNFLDIELHTTYRLPKAIYEYVDEVFKENKHIEELPKLNCNREKDFSSIEIWPLEPAPSKETLFWPTPKNLEQVELTEISHAKKIADYIKKSLDKKLFIASKQKTVEPKDFMILVQKRTDLNLYLSAELTKLNIPVAGLDRIKLNEHLAVKDLLSAAKFVLNPEDDFNTASLLKSPFIGLKDIELIEFAGKKNWYKLLELKSEFAFLKLQNFKSLANQLSCKEFFMTIIFENNIFEYYKQGDLLDYVDALKAFINEMENILKRNKAFSLSDFVNFFEQDEMEVKRDLASSNAVRIMTVHGAKGMESPIVILADSNEPTNSSALKILNFQTEIQTLPLWLTQIGAHPIIEQMKMFRKDEEYREYIRLLYVALTRAQDKLIIIGIASNTKQETWYKLCRKASEKYFIEEDNGNLVYSSGKEIITSTQELKAENIYRYEIPSFAKKEVGHKGIEEQKIILNLRENTSLGEILHKILENYVNKIAPIDELINIEIQKHPNIASIEFNDILKNATLDKYFQKLLSYDFETEVEIGVNNNNKISLLRIDLLVKMEDKIIIVDYKSDHNKGRLEEYQDKLRQYSAAISLIYPGFSIQTQIFWLKLNEWQSC